MVKAKVLKRDVDRAHDMWASAHQNSINPDVDFNVSYLWARWQDLKEQWEAQKGAK